MERYNKTRSFALNQELLSELDELYQAQTEKKLNKRCGTVSLIWRTCTALDRKLLGPLQSFLGTNSSTIV